MSSDQPSQPEQVDASKARRSLRNGFITLVLAGALIVGLLLAVPGLKGVATAVSNMKTEWVVVAVVLQVLSCACYVVAFLRVFERAPFRVGARVALSEEAFGAAVSLGASRVGHDRVHRAAKNQTPADRPAQPVRGAAAPVPLISDPFVKIGNNNGSLDIFVRDDCVGSSC